MPNILQINKKQIIDKFLNPISRISDECSINVYPDHLYALVNDQSASPIILYSKIS